VALLDSLVNNIRERMGITQTWPPAQVREKWIKVEAYRRFAKNDYYELLQHTPEFNRSAQGRELYTPIAIAGEVARYSADLLFSAEPIITYEKDEDLLAEILDANGLAARLVAIAESIAAEGRGALRIIRDDEIAEVPLITHVNEDRVIWDERHGGFIAGGVVVIQREKGNPTGREVYRLLEEHTKGKITRRLFVGRSTQLGAEVPLSQFDEFKDFSEEEDTGLDVPTLIKWDNVSGGKSDIAGQEAILEAINAEVSYGREKSKKSRPVTFVDGSLVDEEGKADLSGIQILRGKNLSRAMGEEPKNLFDTIQPDFQSAEQIAWTDWLIDTALLTMGYSKASYGRDQGGSADSGKALKLRQARTLLKKAGKDRMAKEALINAIAVALAWESGGGSVADYRPEIELGDGLPRDTMEDSQEAQNWKATDSISTEDLIRMRRPDYDDEAVQEELERIDEDRKKASAAATRPAQTEEGDPVEGESDTASRAEAILQRIRSNGSSS